MTKTKDQRPKTKDRLFWIIFALAVVFIYFYGLNIPLLGPDEPRYAQVAREMFERGDWVTPTLGGFDWFEKPALLYWLQIAAYNIFGVTEFAARIGSALFGLGAILSLWILGKFSAKNDFATDAEQAKDEGQRTKNDFANWLFLISASSIGLLTFSRGASFDIILTFPMTASLVGFFIFDSTQRGRDAESTEANFKNNLPLISYVSLFAFYFFIGVSLLAKGLVGIVFPFAIVAFYYVLRFRLPNKTFIFSLFWGTLLSLLVAASWYVPMYQANGWKFIDEFFVQHHFQRYTSNKYLHPQPFWFFWLVLPLMTLPWLPFFLASIWRLVKDYFQRRDAETQKENSAIRNPQSAIRIFALAWMLVPLVFFSLSGSKLPGYILPALPAALILTADYVVRSAQKSKMRDLILKGLACATLAIVFVILSFFVADYARHETVKNLIATADRAGYADAKILTLHNISHNAEFYGANRLVRFADGKQRYLYGPAEVKEFIEEHDNRPVVVLVPLEYLKDLTETDYLTAKVLGDNGELAVAVVTNK